MRRAVYVIVAVLLLGVGVLSASLFIQRHTDMPSTASLPSFTVTSMIPREDAVRFVDPKALVLTIRDVPAGFAVSSQKYMTNSDAASGDAVISIPVVRSSKWGRLTGYERTFERQRSIDTPILGFLSNVASYRTVLGAKLATSYLFTRFRSREQWGGFAPKPVHMTERVGDESRMYLFDTRGMSTIFVVWRSARIQALFGLSGSDGVTGKKALEYVKKMEVKIRRSLVK